MYDLLNLKQRSFRMYESSFHGTDPHTTVVERMSNWLVNSTLFEEAWGYVCVGSMNWWWSEQLCLFTVGAWTAFLYEQGARYRIKRVWAYMLLGQLFAVSIASNLFYVAILCSKPSSAYPKKPGETSASHPTSPAPISFPPVAWISILLAMLTVALTPYTNTKTFLPNLVAMHTLIVVPLLVPGSRESKYALAPSTLYLVIFLLSLPIRSKTILAALSSLPATGQSPYALFAAAWKTLYEHPAQTSIGCDIICSSVGFIVWIACEDPKKIYGGGYEAHSRWFTVPYLLLSTPFASAGVTAPYVLRPQIPEDLEGKEEKRE
ncbi:hypothetical protein FA15DRAFT_734241 [Coprinopsis marcescibilis]|nr:hypothetical protein FA15DRAFT_734241 [Coprinopsis marcescibilis]